MMPSPKSSTLFASGVLIDKKYRLLRQIGEGAMGVVWAAVNVATAREVALKLIHRPETEFRLRLQREARNCGALRHRNVIDIYDMGETEAGEPFLVMQLLTGETVAELLARRRRLDPPAAASIGRDVARGLAAAHAMHIIHRDLKPANIFLHREPDMDEPVVKVLDFGVAKNLSVNDGLHTVQGGAVGSPLYMSPEQVRAEPNVDHRADIWALGVVLFEMLTGMRPFQGDAQAVFMGILTGEIPTVSKYLRRVDQGLVDLIARCMRRDRADRIGSAAEVAALLDRYAERGVGPGRDAALRQSSPEGRGAPDEDVDGGWEESQGGTVALAAQPGLALAAQPASVAQPGSALAAQPASVAQPMSVANRSGSVEGGAGALPLALLGGGPRAPLPVQESPEAHRSPPLGPGQVGAGPASGMSHVADGGPASGAGHAAGAVPRRPGSSGQHLAAASVVRALRDEDVATLPLTRRNADAAGAAGPRAGSGSYPAAGPAAAAPRPPSSSVAAFAAPEPPQASAAPAAPAQPARVAAPQQGSWAMTVRMNAPPMPDAGAGPGGFGAAGALPPGGIAAQPSWSSAPAARLGPEAGASASDSRSGATTATGAPRQAGSSSTTPLVSNHPSVHQAGVHQAQDAQERAPHGGEPRRKRTAATLAIVAAALSLIVVGMLISLRSPETSSAAPEVSGSAMPSLDRAGGDTIAAPERGGAPPRNEEPPAQEPSAPSAEAPPGSSASAPPGSSASAPPGSSASAPPGSSASAPPSSSALAPPVPSAPSALPTSSAAGASAPGGGAGTASDVKPGKSTPAAPSATSQSAKAAPSAASCDGLMFLDRKKCEAKRKK
ncbi:Protein kinase [Sorangium cellulosum So ce56]|uniref:Protein kinase n=1 Tax=Sorangium cellulosum (strain So ce56) TaxID=448385 RepID=A9FDG9_SORC5|nr:serine/threonine-protein kinase [Sorangium cellulosum]CAN91760.1 Protein kinase [Sorangium cellulosum So ce56]